MSLEDSRGLCSKEGVLGRPCGWEEGTVIGWGNE